MPPIMARFWVEVSGPNSSPCGASAAFSSLRITPGCTVTVRAAASMATMSVKCRETSTTMPDPTTCPASDVPAARGISPSECFAANRTSATRSASVSGIATASGSCWYADASVA